MGFFEVFAAALAGFYALIPSYGLAIILLTLAVRLLLLPLSIKQTRSMREMQRIQPEVKRLQTKYKGDRQKMNEEMMKLYKEHNVNPFGGCLPLLMQFPVLIALFYVVKQPLRYMGYAAEEAGGAVTDWVTKEGLAGIMATLQESALARGLDTAGLELNRFLGFLRLDCFPSQVLRSQPSQTIATDCGSGLVSFLPYAVLIALMGVTTWYQSKQMQLSRDPSNVQGQQMQLVAKIMPVMLMVFAFNFPTGVVLYWLTTNVWQIVQQRIILRAVPEGAAGPDGKTAPAQLASGKEVAPGKVDQGNGRVASNRKKAQSGSRKKKRR